MRRLVCVACCAAVVAACGSSSVTSGPSGSSTQANVNGTWNLTFTITPSEPPVTGSCTTDTVVVTFVQADTTFVGIGQSGTEVCVVNGITTRTTVVGTNFMRGAIKGYHVQFYPPPYPECFASGVMVSSDVMQGGAPDTTQMHCQEDGIGAAYSFQGSWSATRVK